MTHLSEEVVRSKESEVLLKKENLQLKTKLDDSLMIDIVDVSKYEKEIEDCHQRMKAMKDEIASKENSLRIVRDKEMRLLQELKKGKILQPQAQGKCKASPPHHPRWKIDLEESFKNEQMKMPLKVLLNLNI